MEKVSCALSENEKLIYSTDGSTYSTAGPHYHRQSIRLYRQMRAGVAQRKLTRSSCDFFLSAAYDHLSRDSWRRIFRASILPTNAFFWYTAQGGEWWLGRNSLFTSTAQEFIVRFLDEPEPVRLVLALTKHTTV